MSFNYFFKALPWLGFFAAITISWIYYLKARNKERLALIEKGADTSKIFTAPAESFRFPWLKIGVIITGIATGISLIILLVFLFPDSKFASAGVEISLLISGFLFGGISMIIAHFIDKPREK